MIITCPNCQTKYQVTYEAIGSAGRKVQCASCQKSWQQAAMPDVTPEKKPDLRVVRPDDVESDRLFDTIEEEALDKAISEEEQAVTGEKPKAVDPVVSKPNKRQSAAEVQERQKALSRRQRAMVSRLPMARLRLGARIVGGAALVAILGFGYFGRVQIVEKSPDMAGLYAAIGLGVNVVGLELESLQSSRSIADGRDVLVVSAQIVGVEPQPISVPPVLVSLLDASGHAVYEWTVTPRVRDLMAGERATFDTRLPLPPQDASSVRLSFAGSRAAGTETPAHTAAPPPGPADGHSASAPPDPHEPPPPEAAPPPEPADPGEHSPVEAQAPAVHH